MRKVFSFIVFVFLFFSLVLFSHKKVFAEECSLTIDPSSTSSNYKGPITITSKDCFPPGLNYKVIALPEGMSLNEAFPSGIGQTEKVVNERIIKPVWDKKPESLDSNMIRATLYTSFDSPQITISKYLKKNRAGSPSGPWTILVCNKKNAGPLKIDASAECDIVGSGTISVGATPPTPTPTPESDQPIIDPIAQSQCTFQVGKEIHLIATNIDLSKKYHWWWTEGRGKGTVNPEFTQEEDEEEFNTDLNYLRFTIPGNETLNRETTEKNPDGYLLCIDLEEKKCVGQYLTPPCPERIERKRREGVNCIRLYFKAYNPKENGIDTSCSANNAGDITPSPVSPLPPCAQWIYLNGTSIPTPAPGEINPIYNDPDFKDRKCAEISTGIGNISTDPFGFVKSILSILLSLSGGIAVILIIISGYRLMTSQGNPEAVQAARDQLTSAIVGFLFIIFSLVILQVVGVDILRIPGFTK